MYDLRWNSTGKISPFFFLMFFTRQWSLNVAPDEVIMASGSSVDVVVDAYESIWRATLYL